MKRRPLLLISLLVMLLSACVPPSPSSSRTSSCVHLYFVSQLEHGPALAWEEFPGADPTAEELIGALLAGPSSEMLSSPFPPGLSLRACRLEDGLLSIDFSEQYGGLSAVSLTLADYALVLTLCQLEEVDSLSITVSGRPLPYRSHHILSYQEALLALEESRSPLDKSTSSR